MILPLMLSTKAWRKWCEPSTLSALAVSPPLSVSSQKLFQQARRKTRATSSVSLRFLDNDKTPSRHVCFKLSFPGKHMLLFVLLPYCSESQYKVSGPRGGGQGQEGAQDLAYSWMQNVTKMCHCCAWLGEFENDACIVW